MYIYAFILRNIRLEHAFLLFMLNDDAVAMANCSAYAIINFKFHKEILFQEHHSV